MTTAAQWGEVVDWIEARFTKGWHVEQALAYLEDVKRFDISDVWAGLYSMYETGQAFAPNGSQLVAAAMKERHKAAVDDVYRSLPETTESRSVTWVQYSTNRFGEVLTPQQVIERVHRDSTTCKTKTCGIHYPPEVEK